MYFADLTSYTLSELNTYIGHCKVRVGRSRIEETYSTSNALAIDVSLTGCKSIAVFLLNKG